MTPELEQLVAETIELTGSSAPALLDDDAPVFVEPRQAESMYLVGLIGGKDVGKSSLVNALIGREISEATSYGPGTETVIAYIHHASVAKLRELLEREVPQQFRIVTHDQAHLARQVLLDLPDIDSRYAEHVQITRRMLRHMLYPIWIQSVEKYADQQPQRLLATVAEGNDPTNFVFALNKIDQVLARDGPSAVEQLKTDFAARVGRTLNLTAPPRVFAISATQPEVGDLGALRQLLSRERSTDAVRASQQLALRRQDRSLLAWLDRQDLPQRLASLQRLERDAEELLAERVATPLLEEALPRLADDPGHRLGLLEPALHKRLARWPIVNVIDTVLSPVLSLVKRNISAAPPTATGVAIDAYLAPGSRPVSAMLQSAFAQLYQTNPAVAALYESRKLWDDLPADAATSELKRRIGNAIDRQRQAVENRVGGTYGIVRPIFRWLLTIGALLWFPFVQPALEVALAPGFDASAKKVVYLVVQLLGVSYLLKNVTFLLIWFVALWALLRWDTQRRVDRMMRRWTNSVALDDPMSLPGQTLAWIDELTEPIRRERARAESLVQRVDALRRSISDPARESVTAAA
jgi:GTPase Era involved in 16S rRNA processing